MRFWTPILSLVLGVSFVSVSMNDAAAGPNCNKKPDHWSCNGDGNPDDGGGGDTGGQDDYTGPDLSFGDYPNYAAPGSYYDWMHADVGLAHYLAMPGRNRI